MFGVGGGGEVNTMVSPDNVLQDSLPPKAVPDLTGVQRTLDN